MSLFLLTHGGLISEDYSYFRVLRIIIICTVEKFSKFFASMAFSYYTQIMRILEVYSGKKVKGGRFLSYSSNLLLVT